MVDQYRAVIDTNLDGDGPRLFEERMQALDLGPVPWLLKQQRPIQRALDTTSVSTLEESRW
jgi:hypothetical protein